MTVSECVYLRGNTNFIKYRVIDPGDMQCDGIKLRTKFFLFSIYPVDDMRTPHWLIVVVGTVKGKRWSQAIVSMRLPCYQPTLSGVGELMLLYILSPRIIIIIIDQWSQTTNCGCFGTKNRGWILHIKYTRLYSRGGENFLPSLFGSALILVYSLCVPLFCYYCPVCSQCSPGLHQIFTPHFIKNNQNYYIFFSASALCKLINDLRVSYFVFHNNFIRLL